MAESEIQKESTNRRVVGVLSALYFTQDIDPITGKPARRILSARQGQEIDVPESEERRLDSLNALLPHGAKPEDAAAHHQERLDAYRAQRGDQEALQRHSERLSAGSGVVNVDAPVDAGPQDLAAYIRDQRLTVDDTVALAEDDPAKARRVLEAERIASDGSPRAGVEQQLAKITEG